MRLTDGQWEALEPYIPDPPRRADGRGRPWRDKRAVLEGILWVLRSGARWKHLPKEYPPYQTCHRRFQQWVAAGVFAATLDANPVDDQPAHLMGDKAYDSDGLDAELAARAQQLV